MNPLESPNNPGVPLLSVIVPTYNRAALLAEALETVRSQEFNDYELIVVDDGSTDDTSAVLERYMAGQPAGKMRVLRQSNAGQGAARNLGIAEARGEYCTFLDSDDRLFPWSFAVVAEAISANERPSVVIGGYHAFATEEHFAAATREPLRAKRWPDIYAFMMYSTLGPCGVFVAQTRLLREAGGFILDRIVGEDVDLMISLGVAPNMVKIESPPTFAYRVHSQSFTRNYEKWYRGACHFIDRYRDGRFPGWPTRPEIHKVAADTIAGLAFFTLYNGGRRQSLSIHLRTIGLQLKARNYDYMVRTSVLILLSFLRIWPWKRGLRDSELQ